MNDRSKFQNVLQAPEFGEGFNLWPSWDDLMALELHFEAKRSDMGWLQSAFLCLENLEFTNIQTVVNHSLRNSVGERVEVTTDDWPDCALYIVANKCLDVLSIVNFGMKYQDRVAEVEKSLADQLVQLQPTPNQIDAELLHKVPTVEPQ